MRKIHSGIVLLCLSLISNASFAQKKELTIVQLLGNAMPEITKKYPAFIKWQDNNHYVIARQNEDKSISNYLVETKSGKETVLPKEASATTSKSVISKNNDLFIKSGETETRITNDEEKESNPTFSPDSLFIAFTRKNDLYTINTQTLKETRITFDGSNTILNGYASWVYYEEILGRSTNYSSFWWSPDSKKIAYMKMDQSKVPFFLIVGEEGLHGWTDSTRYPKVGDPNPEVKIGIVSPEGGNTVWADFNEKDDQYFGKPYWRPNSQSILVQWMNRKQDELKIFDVDISNGSKKLFYTEKEKTWIVLANERIKFLGTDILLRSEKDGWRNIYLLNADGTLKNKVTEGNFWSTEILYTDQKKNILVFSARKENSTRTDLYRVGLDGKNFRRLSFGEFTNDIKISPSGDHFISVYSNAGAPAKTSLYDINGKLLREISDSKGTEFDQYEIAQTTMHRVPSEDGLFNLPVRITWPLHYDSTKKYPVWISIYGGPDAGTVYDGWRFNNMQQWWAKENIIQVSMDHRGSGHFGKKGLEYLYHNLGYWEMQDWIQIVKWLYTKGADPSKVLISGFSYGGYITSYALTYGSYYFTHGLAGGSVIDWNLYDSHYTERFMGTMSDNSKGYESSSVLNHVNKLKGKLLIYHGSMDDNVHMQNSLQLIKKLQEAKKEFDFMIYPGGKHGWSGQQQMHSQNMINRFIYKELL
ncbi:MAG: DPP IV N-terminal domain-containing protein [Chitinophagaceae bacterium]